MSDRVSAELAAIRERRGHLQKPGIGLELMLHGLVSAEDVPRLLAAVEAVLAGHKLITETIPAMGTTWKFCAHCGIKPGGPGASWPCPTVAAIERALTGEDGSDGRQ
jgi:hypothetical protein